MSYENAITNFALASQLKVFQIVNATTTTATTTSSTSFIDTNLTAAITPSSTAHRVLVLVSGNLRRDNVGGNHWLTIKRGSTNLGDANAGFGGWNNVGDAIAYGFPVHIHWVDSPASASSTTYTVQARVSNGAASLIVFDSHPASITLIEIA